MKPLRKLYTNSHYPLTLSYRDKDKNPVPLVGYTAQLMIRKSLVSDPIITKNATIEEQEGNINFVVSPEDTVDVLVDDTEGMFLIGVTMTSPDGQTTTLFQSTIEIKENIVRP